MRQLSRMLGIGISCVVVWCTCNLADAANFQTNKGVWKVEFSHEEVQSAATITAALGTAAGPATPAIEAVSGLIIGVDKLGGGKGVTVSGIIGVPDVVVVPSGTIDVYGIAVGAISEGQHVLVHWKRVGDSIASDAKKQIDKWRGKKPKPEVNGPSAEAYAYVMAAVQITWHTVFDRPIDAEGVKFRTDQVFQEGWTIRRLVQEFIGNEEQEFYLRYIKDKSPEEAVKNLFVHILARDPSSIKFGNDDVNIKAFKKDGWHQLALNFLNCEEYNQWFGDNRPPQRHP